MCGIAVAIDWDGAESAVRTRVKAAESDIVESAKKGGTNSRVAKFGKIISPRRLGSIHALFAAGYKGFARR